MRDIWIFYIGFVFGCMIIHCYCNLSSIKTSFNEMCNECYELKIKYKELKEEIFKLEKSSKNK